MTIYLTMQKDTTHVVDLDDTTTLVVEFDFNRYDHNVFQDGQHLGRLKLREFFFNGWKCIKREVKNDRL